MWSLLVGSVVLRRCEFTVVATEPTQQRFAPSGPGARRPDHRSGTDVQAWLEPDTRTDDRGYIIALVKRNTRTRRNLYDDAEREPDGTLLAGR
jgi:hypothetical protein